MRSIPDSADDDNIIGNVYKEEQYEMTVFDGEWGRLTLPDGLQSWVYMGYMDHVGEKSEQSD